MSNFGFEKIQITLEKSGKSLEFARGRLLDTLLLVIGHNLRWVSHVQCILQRVRKLRFVIHQLSHALTVSHCWTAYYSYVQSLLEYGIGAQQ